MAADKQNKGKCPECETEIILDKDDEVDDYINCDECSTELMITATNPATFEIVEEEYDEGEDEDEH